MKYKAGFNFFYGSDPLMLTATRGQSEPTLIAHINDDAKWSHFVTALVFSSSDPTGSLAAYCQAVLLTDPAL